MTRSDMYSQVTYEVATLVAEERHVGCVRPIEVVMTAACLQELY